MYYFDNRLLRLIDYGIGLVKVRGRGEREGGEMEERRGEEEGVDKERVTTKEGEEEREGGRSVCVCVMCVYVLFR